MSGKRALWRDRRDERVRERRRRQGRVLAAMLQAETDGSPAEEPAGIAGPDFDLSSWLMLGPAVEPMRSPEPPVLEP